MKALAETDDRREIAFEHLLDLFDGQPPRRVLMVCPPGVDKGDFRLSLVLSKRYWAYPPLGTGVLCRRLKQAGYDVDLLDLNFVMLADAHALKEAYDYDSWKDALASRIEKFKPDLIGISCMYTMHHGCMKMIAEEIKARWNLPVMAGGVHVTADRAEVLKDCKVDFVGLYECDNSLPTLLDVLNGKEGLERIDQVAMMVSGEEIVINDGSLPPAGEDFVSPDYCGADLRRYDDLGQVGVYGFARQGRPASVAITERGCRAKCSFCSVRLFNGTKVRRRGAVAVADELERLHDEHGIRHITWLDDDFLFSEAKTIETLEEITSRKLDLTWDATNGLIAAAITPRLLDAMVASGCIGFNLGIESGTPEILRKIHKPGTVESFLKTRDLLLKYPHLYVKSFLIIGFPRETFGQIMNTINLAVELAFDWSPMQNLNPMPASEIYLSMVEEGLIAAPNRQGLGWMAGPFSSLNQKSKEEIGKDSDEEYINWFERADMDAVPTREQLTDLWFVVDWKINYEPIFTMTDEHKLRKKTVILTDIADRISQENPLANYYLAVAERKLSMNGSADSRTEKAREYLAQSDYWQRRFEVLGIVL